MTIARYFEHLAMKGGPADEEDEDDGTGELAAKIDRPLVQELVRGVTQHWAELDDTLTKLSQNWRLERMAVVERNVIRIALYELQVLRGRPRQRRAQRGDRAREALRHRRGRRLHERAPRSRGRRARHPALTAPPSRAMTLDDIEEGLPNGLHDSRMHGYTSVADEQRAEFVLDVWVGDLHSTVTSERERHRRARLELIGLGYLVVEEPDSAIRPRLEVARADRLLRRR